MNCATRCTAQNVVRFHVRFPPPCKAALIEHCKRANYQSKMCRVALKQVPEVPSPVGYGWEMLLDELNGDSLDTKWMSCKSAPDEESRIKIYTK